MKKKRIFVAINFPEEIKNEIEIYKKEIQSSLSEEYQSVFKWVREDNFHLTLFFLGYLEPREIEILKEILAETVPQHLTFNLVFDKIVLGPRPQKPRLIWIEGEETKKLLKLRESLKKKLLNSPLPIDRKEIERFTSHITLARIRTWQWRYIPMEERPEIEKEIELRIPVRSIDLMESRLKRPSPEYLKLDSFYLKKT